MVRFARPIRSDKPPMKALNAPMALEATSRYKKNWNDMW